MFQSGQPGQFFNTPRHGVTRIAPVSVQMCIRDSSVHVPEFIDRRDIVISFLRQHLLVRHGARRIDAHKTCIRDSVRPVRRLLRVRVRLADIVFPVSDIQIFVDVYKRQLTVLPEVFADPFMGLLSSVLIYAVGGGLLEVLVSPVMELSLIHISSLSAVFRRIISSPKGYHKTAAPHNRVTERRLIPVL